MRSPTLQKHTQFQLVIELLTGWEIPSYISPSSIFRPNEAIIKRHLGHNAEARLVKGNDQDCFSCSLIIQAWQDSPGTSIVIKAGTLFGNTYSTRLTSSELWVWWFYLVAATWQTHFHKVNTPNLNVRSWDTNKYYFWI